MTDTCSLTPPSSPTDISEAKRRFQQKEESQSLASIPCFSCKTSTFNPITSTTVDYLNGGLFKKLLKNEILFHNVSSTILLFNKPFSSTTALFTDTKRLFSFTKKHFSILQLSANPKERSCIRDEELANLRSQICNFLTYVKDFLLKLSFRQLEKQKQYTVPTMSVQLKKFLSEFLKELQLLLLFVGRLCDIQDAILTNDMFVNGNRNSAACYHYYHVCLDVWWSVIEILHITRDLFSSDLSGNDSCIISDNNALTLFNQIMSIVLWDLCFLASKRFKSLNLSMNSSSSPFICPCINQFWIQLIVLLDKRNNLYNEKSFWLSLHQIFQQAIQNKTSENVLSASECSFNQFFCVQYKQFVNDDLSECFLWLMSHIAPLYKHSDTADSETSKNTKNCYMISKYLIECILNDECSAKNESRLRSVLATFLLLAKHWEPTGDVLLPLTDFYIKKIDDTFCKSTTDVLGMSYIFNTSVSWLDSIRNVISEDHKLSMSETSFQIYLRILSFQLTHSGLNSSLWRQLKGRIYSKFTPKRLRDLTEAGLQNCFSVFLTIALTVSIEEISPKICDFFLLIHNAPENFKKQLVAWKAMFVLLFIMQQKGQTLDKVAPNMVKTFNDTCSRYCQSQRDPMKQSNIMNLLMVYITSMKELFESSPNLLMSEYLLIGSGFSVLLPACTNESNHILGIFLDILDKFRFATKERDESMLVHETHFVLLLQSLLEHVFSYVKDRASSNSVPYQLADLAVNFTNLAIKFNQPMATFTSHTYVTVFKYFANSEHVNAVVSVRYLNLALNNVYIIKHLKEGISDLHVLLMRGWIKCCISLLTPNDDAVEITKWVLQQEEIKKVFPGIQQMVFPHRLHDFLSIQLYKIMGESYQNCLSLQEKNHMREQAQLYFSNISVIVSVRMMQEQSAVFYNHLYKLMGHLIEYCAPLLYIRHDSNSVLPKLIDTLLFPHIMFPKEKFLPALLSNPIKKNLTLFITGILKLDYRNEPYVKRKLKEIIVHYVDNFSLVNNPIMDICLKSSFFGKHVFPIIITILKEHMIANISVKSASGFRFFIELISKASSQQKEEIREILIDDMLMLLLKCEGAVAFPVKDLLNALFNSMKRETHFIYQKQLLLPICKKIIQEKLAWSPFKVFRVLEFVGEHFSKLFITELIQCITEHIEYIESQRGSGVDAVLRKELKALTDKLLISKKS